MRNLLVALLRWLAEALVRLYYPRRTVQGDHNVPPTGPTLYVANHPNGLLDPLVLRVSIHRAVRFLAKNTLWGNPFGRLAMDAFGCLPIYRQQDLRQQDLGQQDLAPTGPGGGTATRRNEEALTRCRAELAAGAELALYPEGTSHSEPELKPLKTGAARIALAAVAQAAATPGARAPLLVPMGLHYEDKAVFRSGVHVVVGARIDLSRHVERFAVDQRSAVEALTDDIRARLNDLVLQAETHELLAGIARVASWTAASPDDDAPDRRHARTRELLAAYGRLKASDPARVEQIAKNVRRYARILERLGVQDPWALEAPRVTLGDVAASIGRAALMTPAAMWGVCTSWVPYRLSGMVATRMSRDEDVLSTIKMIVGFTFLVVAWIVEALVLGWRFGVAWGVGSLLAAPASGYAALRLGENLREVSEAVRHLGWRTRETMAERLGARRRRLAEEVSSALRDSGP
jgi:glycerol-3-phosphate O-acyltransferase/dihydroxyacetone phosphate acyltransferase